MEKESAKSSWKDVLSGLSMEKSKPKVYINGKEVGHIVGEDISLSPDDYRPIREDYKPAVEIKVEIKEDPETMKKMREFLEKTRAEYVRRINEWIEDCLRTRVKPPIKGDITEGKIRWRGLSLAFGPVGEFYGILQRRKILYSVDGNTYTDTQKEEGDV